MTAVLTVKSGLDPHMIRGMGMGLVVVLDGPGRTSGWSGLGMVWSWMVR